MLQTLSIELTFVQSTRHSRRRLPSLRIRAPTTSRSGVLHALNLGDSGFMVVSDKGVSARSLPKLHREGMPYQLASRGTLSDKVSAGVTASHTLKAGQYVVVCSDGLTDNMSPADIGEFFAEFAGKMRTKQLARRLAVEAQSRGLKADDISVVVARLYDANSNELLAHLPHDKPVWCVRLSNNGALLAVAGYDCKLTVYDCSSRPEDRNFCAPLQSIKYESTGGPAFIWSCAFSADNRMLALGARCYLLHHHHHLLHDHCPHHLRRLALRLLELQGVPVPGAAQVQRAAEVAHGRRANADQHGARRVDDRWPRVR